MVGYLGTTRVVHANVPRCRLHTPSVTSGSRGPSNLPSPASDHCASTPSTDARPRPWRDHVQRRAVPRLQEEEEGQTDQGGKAASLCPEEARQSRAPGAKRSFFVFVLCSRGPDLCLSFAAAGPRHAPSACPRWQPPTAPTVHAQLEQKEPGRAARLQREAAEAEAAEGARTEADVAANLAADEEKQRAAAAQAAAQAEAAAAAAEETRRDQMMPNSDARGCYSCVRPSRGSNPETSHTLPPWVRVSHYAGPTFPRSLFIERKAKTGFKTEWCGRDPAWTHCTMPRPPVAGAARPSVLQQRGGARETAGISVTSSEHTPFCLSRQRRWVVMRPDGFWERCAAPPRPCRPARPHELAVAAVRLTPLRVAGAVASPATSNHRTRTAVMRTQSICTSAHKCAILQAAASAAAARPACARGSPFSSHPLSLLYGKH